jgi:hypothetical protein
LAQGIDLQDSIVARFDSTPFLRRLFQQHRSKADISPVPRADLFRLRVELRDAHRALAFA